jgi:hypothetical protein
MGTEVGQLGGYGFQGAIFSVDGSCKDGKMGSGCCKFQGDEADNRGKRQTNVHESAEKRKARFRTGRSLGELC